MDNSNFCNDGNGDLVCGQCVCDAGWYVCASFSADQRTMGSYWDKQPCNNS